MNIRRFLLILFFVAACSSPEQKALEQGKELINQGELKKAVIHLRTASRKYPKNEKILYHFGWVLLLRDYDDGAYQMFLRAVALAPKYWGGHRGLGKLHLKQNEPEEAIKDFQKAIEVDPKNGLLYFDIAEAYIILENPKEADAMVQKAIEINPKKGDIVAMAGHFYLQRDQYQRSEDLLEQASRLSFKSKYWETRVNCFLGESIFKSIPKTDERISLDIKRLQTAQKAFAKCKKALGKQYVYQLEETEISKHLGKH